jgi:hypothetical protein
MIIVKSIMIKMVSIKRERSEDKKNGRGQMLLSCVRAEWRSAQIVMLYSEWRYDIRETQSRRCAKIPNGKNYIAVQSLSSAILDTISVVWLDKSELYHAFQLF